MSTLIVQLVLKEVGDWAAQARIDRYCVKIALLFYTLWIFGLMTRFYSTQAILRDGPSYKSRTC